MVWRTSVYLKTWIKMTAPEWYTKFRCSKSRKKFCSTHSLWTQIKWELQILKSKENEKSDIIFNWNNKISSLNSLKNIENYFVLNRDHIYPVLLPKKQCYIRNDKKTMSWKDSMRFRSVRFTAWDSEAELIGLLMIILKQGRLFSDVSDGVKFQI